jgi:hypothetical protein
MRLQSKKYTGIKILSRTFFPVLLLILSILVSSCGLLPFSSDGEGDDMADIEQSIQATIMADQATQAYLDAVKQQTAISIQATETALSAGVVETEPPQPEVEPETTEEVPSEDAQEEPAETQPPDDSTESQTAAQFSEEDFEAWMEDADILLYEDAVNAPFVARYVKDALDNMGLEYKDDGSAIGWLKSDLLGSQWDLVIVALEDPGKPPMGEYFEYLQKAINDGSAVILEIWFLDIVGRGEVASLLADCGVEFESDFGVSAQAASITDLINWPLPGKSDHPIFNEPNSGFRWTNIATLGPFLDLGDYIKLSGKKEDAELLLGQIATEKNTHGTLAVCMDGKFIIQTFHTHNLAYEEAVPLWENYIYNALKAKYLEEQ